MDDSLHSQSTEEKELVVLDYELKTLKKDRRVYVQQPGSNIYFLSNKTEALNKLEQDRENLREKQKAAK
ncbi:hypothetical protein Pcinc_032008 [Petrolisthes cinctipes]|uniref:Uncharacterized protein n=1 Tax=Petrolisthes cinctipes TaxID=88211 RepID=A0AAE1EVG3_PETCI|nr:hypothetical protein Pcinc_032008 [Petrolisthes cinctipes]